MIHEINATLRNARMHIIAREVDALKGSMFKAALEFVIQKYGIKDDAIPGQVIELFSMVSTEGTGAILQEAANEFRAEYYEL